MMFKLPRQSKVEKTIPKNKFYEKTKINSRIKQQFVDQVEKIVWSYTLRPDTINTNATEKVEEIQIFRIELKEKVIPKSILEKIAKAIPYPILFVLSYQDSFTYASFYQEQRYESTWDQELEFDFVGSDLEQIHQQIIKTFLEEHLQKSDFSTAIDLHTQKQQLLKEISVLENKMQKEKQFNKKVVFNTQIQKLQQQLNQL